jgi:hypothetical protein
VSLFSEKDREKSEVFFQPKLLVRNPWIETPGPES